MTETPADDADRKLRPPSRIRKVGVATTVVALVGCASPSGDPDQAKTVTQQHGNAGTPTPARGSVATISRYVVLDGPGAFASLPAGVAPSSRRGRARVARRAEELRVAHAALSHRLEALGATVVADAVLVANVIQVRLPVAVVDRVRVLEGVATLETPTTFRPSLASSVPLVGAPTLWEQVTPWTGESVRIGIVDTGLDYFHADFGGAGTPGAHAADDHTIIEAGTFPTTKVLGGIDLAGDNYDANGVAGALTPTPDDDPVDCNGHGTHVAGIAAGVGVLSSGAAFTGPYAASLDPAGFSVMPGVAPEASLYAIKVFGCDGASDLLLPALEWAADPDGDLDPSDRLDVVNASLGSDFDAGTETERAAIAALTAAGTLVVAAQGNATTEVRVPFSASFPASVSEVLAVGATLKEATSETFLALDVTAPSSISGTYPVGEAAVGPTVASLGGFSGELVMAEPALGCDPLTNASEIAGAIAVVDRGTCFFTDKASQAADAGAIGVLIIDNIFGDLPNTGFSGNSPPPSIPMWMLRRADGDHLKSALPASVAFSPNVTTDVVVGPDFSAKFSSRGPTTEQRLLKPDLSAPGVEIASAAMGTGSQGTAFSGTSMASPAVAGAAALLRQAFPTEAPLGIKERLVSTSRPVVNGFDDGFLTTLAGAGRVQVDDAAETEITAAVDGLEGEVGASFGMLRLAEPTTESRTITVTNHGATEAQLDATVAPALSWPGVSVTVRPTTVTVPPGASTSLTLSLSVEPASLPPSPTYEAFTESASSAPEFEMPNVLLTEASGFVVITPQGGADEVARVAYHGAVQSAANRHVAGVAGCAADGPSLTLALGGDPAPHGNATSVLELGTETTSNDGLTGPDAARDLVAVGHLAVPDDDLVYFGVVTAAPWTTPARGWTSEVAIEIDVDADGTADHFVFAESFAEFGATIGEVVHVGSPFARLSGPAGEPQAQIWPLNGALAAYAGGMFFAGDRPETYETHIFNNRVLVLPANLSGLAATTFAYRAVSGVSRLPARLGLPMPDPVDSSEWVTVDALSPHIRVVAGHYAGPLHPEADELQVEVLDSETSVLVLHHSNASNHFEVVDVSGFAGSDLKVAAGPGAALEVGDEATASFVVSLAGDQPRSDVSVALGSTGTIASVVTSTGSCDASSCNLGDLAPGDTVTIDVVTEAATEAGELVVTATVTGAGCDVDAGNDGAREAFVVASPPAMEAEGGCGCRTAPARHSDSGWAMLATGLLFLRRRRSRASARH